MSFPTKSCFTSHPQSWDPSLLTHPAMAFMHRFTRGWCESKSAHTQPFSDWYPPNYELVSHDGRTFKGEEAAKAFIKSIGLYSASTVDIKACYLEETEDRFTGVATGLIFANLVGEEGEKTCIDSEGRGWEICMPRAYECTFVKDPTAPINGLKLSKMVVFGDMQPVMRLAAERGLSV